MKTLYVSDLDGTFLLNADAELSSYTVETLNRLISSGAYFPWQQHELLPQLYLFSRMKVNVPIILMNGVLVYDIQSRQYIKKEVLSRTPQHRLPLL